MFVVKHVCILASIYQNLVAMDTGCKVNTSLI